MYSMPDRDGDHTDRDQAHRTHHHGRPKNKLVATPQEHAHAECSQRWSRMIPVECEATQLSCVTPAASAKMLLSNEL